jgi:3'-phosphoadenosine 5'-phosphosulfate sulfotransferase (PAPS reductase)/FAD synthetase
MATEARAKRTPEPEPNWDVLYERIAAGCAPCTRALAPGEDARDGRWWWEEHARKECGILCAVETGGLEHALRAIVGASDD